MAEGNGEARRQRPRRSPAVVLVTLLTGVEALALAAVTLTWVVDVISAEAQSRASGVALAVLAAIATLWVAAVARGLWSGRQWSRAGALTWQVLQGAVAIGMFRGAFAVPALGWALLAPALAVIVLVMTKSVIAHTRAAESED